MKNKICVLFASIFLCSACEREDLITQTNVVHVYKKDVTVNNELLTIATNKGVVNIDMTQPLNFYCEGKPVNGKLLFNRITISQVSLSKNLSANSTKADMEFILHNVDLLEFLR